MLSYITNCSKVAICLWLADFAMNLKNTVPYQHLAVFVGLDTWYDILHIYVDVIYSNFGSVLYSNFSKLFI